jgi:hypothetical protein
MLDLSWAMALTPCVKGLGLDMAKNWTGPIQVQKQQGPPVLPSMVEIEPKGEPVRPGLLLL